MKALAKTVFKNTHFFIAVLAEERGKRGINIDNKKGKLGKNYTTFSSGDPFMQDDLTLLFP